VQSWERDERLEDVITDHSFLHVSEVGPPCDEVCPCEKQGLFLAQVFGIDKSKILLKKPRHGSRTASLMKS